MTDNRWRLAVFWGCPKSQKQAEKRGAAVSRCPRVPPFFALRTRRSQVRVLLGPPAFARLQRSLASFGLASVLAARGRLPSRPSGSTAARFAHREWFRVLPGPPLDPLYAVAVPSLKTTDRYSHTDQELEYRRSMASKVGLGFDLGPMDPRPSPSHTTAATDLKRSA